MPFMGILKFLCEGGRIIALVRCRPINAKAGALCQHAMEHHDGPAIAVQKWMAMCKIPMTSLGLRSHQHLVPSVLRPMVDRAVCPAGRRMRFSPGRFPCSRQDAARWSSGLVPPTGKPRQTGSYASPARLVGRLLLRCEPSEGGIKAGREGCVLRLPDNFRIFGSGDVAQITALLAVAKGIERHGLVWWR